jgi:hypothetical protein
MVMHESVPSRVFSHGRIVIVVWLTMPVYWWLYYESVRMPFVAFHSQAWPYYALGRHLRPISDQASMGVGEYRLPDKAAEWFFYPANWLDRKLHPKRWAEVDPKKP